MLNNYRITKYNPSYRDDLGRYLLEEWTDFSDIGSVFQGNVFTREEYLKTEKNYIDCIMQIIRKSNADSLSINSLEITDESVKWYPNQIVSNSSVENVISDCLRNKCWCKLIGQSFFIHFGYDFYVYVGCILPYNEVNAICTNYNLFCEQFESPYYDCTDDGSL